MSLVAQLGILKYQNDTHTFFIHFLFISVQLSFKFTIKFVGLNVNLINLIINLKIIYV